MQRDIQHNNTQHNAVCPVMLSVIYAKSPIQALYVECRYAECNRVLFAECYLCYVS
jgi:hypothetical protein